MMFYFFIVLFFFDNIINIITKKNPAVHVIPIDKPFQSFFLQSAGPKRSVDFLMYPAFKKSVFEITLYKASYRCVVIGRIR
jgi:hypothetical protein